MYSEDGALSLDRTPAPSLTLCVTPCTLLLLSALIFLTCKMGVIEVSQSHGWVERVNSAWLVVGTSEMSAHVVLMNASWCFSYDGLFIVFCEQASPHLLLPLEPSRLR